MAAESTHTKTLVGSRVSTLPTYLQQHHRGHDAPMSRYNHSTSYLMSWHRPFWTLCRSATAHDSYPLVSRAIASLACCWRLVPYACRLITSRLRFLDGLALCRTVRCISLVLNQFESGQLIHGKQTHIFNCYCDARVWHVSRYIAGGYYWIVDRWVRPRKDTDV